MGLRIRFNERYEPVTRVVYYPTEAFLASVSAMAVIVLQDHDGLFLALTRMFDIARMKVAVVAVISANRANSLLFGKQLGSKGLSFARVHRPPAFSSPRSQLTSTPST